MSIVTMIMGDSGAGKTFSLLNLHPEPTLLIQPSRKSLPFSSKNWKKFTPENTSGSIYVSDNYQLIHKAISVAVKKGKKIIIVDDGQYLLCNDMMRRSEEKGFDKFTIMAKEYWQLINYCHNLPDDVRVYFMCHTQTTDDGQVKPKTIGKLLDSQIVIEGLFTTVLRARAQDGRHFFSTKTSGIDCVKSPFGLFEQAEIDNCLKLIDDAICDFEGIDKLETPTEAATEAANPTPTKEK